MADNRISWHPGFLQALQLEFEDDLDFLTFEAEHQLTSEPLRIDVLIIKKDMNRVIANPLAGIFRAYNLFEFKSITDNLSVAEFHKGLIYVLLYAELHKLELGNLSLVCGNEVSRIGDKAYKRRMEVRGRGRGKRDI